MQTFQKLIPEVAEYLATKDYKIYEKSYINEMSVEIIFVRFGLERYFLALGTGPFYTSLEGENFENCKICPWTHANRLVFNAYLTYTQPRAFGKDISTLGTGDRLGLASPAHIRSVEGKEIKPILAQQSMRELKLTERTYRDVLDDVCYAVLIEGYTGGFGADADHLKEENDIKAALSVGYTMITLDCSEKIFKDAEQFDANQLKTAYFSISEDQRMYFDLAYIKTAIPIESLSSYSQEELMRNVLIYKDAIEYIVHIYEACILPLNRDIDFEVSLDETDNQTSHLGHYLVANELLKRGVKINSLAPRFIGEFQKGIDYIGDISSFDADIKVHAEIADFFSYKLSIHSGSDKFSIFGSVGKNTQGRFHLKTSGTSWLEAVKVIMEKNPQLYRKMHVIALEHFNEALNLYHVGADISGFVDISNIPDNALVDLMSNDNARQLIHITYGYILNTRLDGVMLGEKISETLKNNEELYWHFLGIHFQKHLKMLGI